MSTVDVRPVHNVRERADYLECGAGKKRAMHKAAGTDRLAVMYCDDASIAAFVARGEALAEAYGRTVEAQGYLQNFEREEFDVDDAEDLQRVNDLGFLYAKEMHPNSDALVVTHADSDGRHAHNHILVLNHDNVTGRALTKFRTHASARKVNDALMREQGQRCLADDQVEKAADLPFDRRLCDGVRTTQSTYWAIKRGELLTEGKSFDAMLGDAVSATMLDPEVDSPEELIEALSMVHVDGAPDQKRDGITVLTSPRHGGITLRAWDSERGRVSRRSASKLSPAFTLAGQQAFFAEKHEHRQQENTAETVVLDGQSATCATGAAARFDIDAAIAAMPDLLAQLDFSYLDDIGSAKPSAAKKGEDTIVASTGSPEQSPAGEIGGQSAHPARTRSNDSTQSLSPRSASSGQEKSRGVRAEPAEHHSGQRKDQDRPEPRRRRAARPMRAGEDESLVDRRSTPAHGKAGRARPQKQGSTPDSTTHRSETTPRELAAARFRECRDRLAAAVDQLNPDNAEMAVQFDNLATVDRRAAEIAGLPSDEVAEALYERWIEALEGVISDVPGPVRTPRTRSANGLRAYTPRTASKSAQQSEPEI